MGIFGVNMPLLYGEGGQRAFLRLQDEILKATDDQSIFARKLSLGLTNDKVKVRIAGRLPGSFPRCSQHATNVDRVYIFQQCSVDYDE